MSSAKWSTAHGIGLCGLLAIVIVSLHLNDAVWQQVLDSGYFKLYRPVDTAVMAGL